MADCVCRGLEEGREQLGKDWKKDGSWSERKSGQAG